MSLLPHQRMGNAPAGFSTAFSWRTIAVRLVLLCPIAFTAFKEAVHPAKGGITPVMREITLETEVFARFSPGTSGTERARFF